MGTYSQPIFLNYFWDSGSGFNKYEENNIWLGKYVNFEHRPHAVEVGVTADRLGEPQKICLKSLLIKGPETGSNYKNILDEDVDIGRSQPFQMELEFSEIVFSAQNDAAGSKIFIRIDEQQYIILFPKREMISVIKIKKFIPGDAVNVVPLPQLSLFGLKLQGSDQNSDFMIQNVTHVSNHSRTELPLSRFGDLDENIEIPGKYLKNTKFHLLLFLIQLFLALFIAWIFYELLSYVRRLKCPPGSSLTRNIFIENGRWVFWVIFTASGCSLLFWLLGQWPGDLNWDTFTIWSMVQNLSLDNKFSFVYVLIVAGLSQLYNSPAAVAVFQILLMSGLIAWIFHFSYKNNASKKLLILLFILMVVSIPIGMSTILVNTSTFFALLTSFWGFYLFRLGFYKKKGLDFHFSNKHLMVLAFLFYLLLSIRYNGMIYIVILPLTVLLLKIFSKKTFIKFMAYSITIFFVFHFGVGSLLHVHRNTNYRFRNLSYKIPTLVHFFAHKDLFHSNDFEQDRKILGKVEDVDKLTRDYRIEDFSRFYAVIEDKWMENEAEINHLFYKSVINNIPLYLAYRTKIFASALGFTEFNDTLFYLRGKSTEVIKISRPLSQRQLFNRPVIPGLAWLQNYVLRVSSDYGPGLKPKLFVWNTGISLFILIVILLAYKWLPLSAGVSFFILAQVPFLFIALPTIHWRYLYFIFLFGYLVLFLVLTEHRSLIFNKN